jgi:hypothetical protein
MSDLSKVCGRLGNRAASMILGAHLADLDDCWLELHCCAGVTLLPVRLIRQRRGDDERLAEILPRLACKLCKSPPRRAWLNETPHRVAGKGPEPGWAVQLIPRLDLDHMAEAAE